MSPAATTTGSLSSHLSSEEDSSNMPFISAFSVLATKHEPAPPDYRPAKRLPFELEEQVRVYLEETLYPQALRQLITYLTTGLSSSDLSQNRPAYIPPPSHIALISTLAVHPSFTSRTFKPVRHEASSLALQYLSQLSQTIGPVGANFGVAYTFPSRLGLSRRGTTPRRRAASPDKGEDAVKLGNAEKDEAIMSELAGSGSLWVNAGDAWAAIGWAFNCSVAHKKRWQVWRAWLTHLINVAERDWALRKPEGEKSAKESLIAKWVEGIESKRIMRAIFANGRGEGVDFTEVWRNETKERRQKEHGWETSKVKAEVDIENGEFGDYFKNSSDEEEDDELEAGEDDDSLSIEDSMLDAGPNLAAESPLPSGTAPLGGPEALALRLRLLALLASLAGHYPELYRHLGAFTHDLHAFIRPLPLVTYAAIISRPALAPFELPQASYLVQYEAINLRESAAPVPDNDMLDQAMLEKYYLPWAAGNNGVADNAKLGACVETLVRLFDSRATIVWTESLQEIAEQGIQKREAKAKRGGKKKGEAGLGSSEVDAAWLRSSGERVRVVLDIAKEMKIAD